MSYIGSKPANKIVTSSDMEDGIITSAKIVDATIATADVANDAITLAKMAGGTDGNIISYDASGNPVAVATGTDGQVLTSTGAGSPPAFEALPGGGKVLQVVHTTYTSTAVTTSATPADISGFSASITPSSASNKVLVLVSVQMGGTNPYGYLLLLRNSTSLSVGTTASGVKINTFISSGTFYENAYSMKSSSNSYLDSPSTTSATTYKMQFANPYGGNTFYINRQNDAGDAVYIQYPVSSITLLEIAG